MPADGKDYRLAVCSLGGGEQSSTPAPGLVGRPYLSVQFTCCSVYTRIYRSADGKNYRGRCPRCGRSVNFVVGPGGTDARVFVVE